MVLESWKKGLPTTRRFLREETALQMAVRSAGVIPIRRNVAISDDDQLAADVAFNLWLSSPFRCGPPEQAFFTALRMVKGKSSVGPFLVPKRIKNLHPIIVRKRRSSRGPQ